MIYGRYQFLNRQKIVMVFLVLHVMHYINIHQSTNAHCVLNLEEGILLVFILVAAFLYLCTLSGS